MDEFSFELNFDETWDESSDAELDNMTYGKRASSHVGTECVKCVFGHKSIDVDDPLFQGFRA